MGTVSGQMSIRPRNHKQSRMEQERQRRSAFYRESDT